MPKILPIQEAENRRIAQKKISETPPQQKKAGCSGEHLSSQLWWEVQNKRFCSPGQSGQKIRPYLQNNHTKKSEGIAQAVEGPPSKCEAPSSNPSMEKKREIMLITLI
jgi:hypothetical protein